MSGSCIVQLHSSKAILTAFSYQVKGKYNYLFIFGSSKNSVYIFHLTVSQKNNLLQLPNKKLPNLAVSIPHSFPSECGVFFFFIYCHKISSLQPCAVNF